MMMYPFLFEPNLHTVVWGGQRLTAFKGLPKSDVPIGESWEVSAVPSSTSIIANGDLAGKDLNSVIEEHSEEVLGRAVSRRYHGQLPLLVKFIDARKDLSIQVHPNDAMAQREHGKMGKSEMWYIIDAQPGSFLYAGFNKEISPEEYKEHIRNNTITEVLAKHTVKPGDVFYLPAGRVHAIGAGILLAEVQQSSDVTYRIYDYNRPGLDGRPRELHTEQAAQALDFHVLDEYRTFYSDKLNRANLVIDSPYFTIRVTESTGAFHRNLVKYDSFVICMCMEGDCRIRIRKTGYTIDLPHGNSALIPAAIADYDIVPVDGKSKTLEAFINNLDLSLAGKVTRFLHIT
ncbi:MAG: class I mannose-6-phosphate isomerase [Prevotella sp.]|nr:class I mannose-6-phosphate isomerase [Prevotella sp.]MDE6012214.1 class I mannose-6-phosphate isomerase [Prevotella sp.]MDE6689291.1 class I mannose-6-phosphate isomerase [Prevotella sp.]